MGSTSIRSTVVELVLAVFGFAVRGDPDLVTGSDSNACWCEDTVVIRSTKRLAWFEVSDSNALTCSESSRVPMPLDDGILSIVVDGEFQAAGFSPALCQTPRVYATSLTTA